MLTELSPVHVALGWQWLSLRITYIQLAERSRRAPETRLALSLPANVIGKLSVNLMANGNSNIYFCSQLRRLIGAAEKINQLGMACVESA